VTGDPIDGLLDAERIDGAYLLHAGTALDQAGQLISAGGRVLNVVGTGTDLAAARGAAYAAAARIRMRGGWYRADIAAPAGGKPSGNPPCAAPAGSEPLADPSRAASPRERPATSRPQPV
jgi:phosphoribosylamine--glycine ligase